VDLHALLAVVPLKIMGNMIPSAENSVALLFKGWVLFLALYG
jgi:hypothetical protein